MFAPGTKYINVAGAVQWATIFLYIAFFAFYTYDLNTLYPAKGPLPSATKETLALLRRMKEVHAGCMPGMECEADSSNHGHGHAHAKKEKKDN